MSGKSITLLLTTAICFAFMAASPSANAKEKGWPNTYQVEQYGTVHAVYRPKTLTLSDGESWVTLKADSGCKENLQFKVTFSKSRFDIKPFLIKQTSANLGLKSLVKALPKIFEKHCDLAKYVLIDFTYWDQKNKRSVDYIGYLSKDTGWKLKDGMDDSVIFSMQHTDAYKTAHAYYHASCNQAVGVVRGKGGFSALAIKAVELAKKFQRMCPSVKELKFVLNPAPGRMVCKEGKECFLTLHKGGKQFNTGEVDNLRESLCQFDTSALFCNDWYPNSSQFTYLKTIPIPIKNFSDISEVLAAGKFEILKDFPSIYKHFYVTFITSYSDYCSSQIRDPIAVDMQLMERTVDSSGSVVSERKAAPPKRVIIEKKYAAAWESLRNSIKTEAFGDVLAAMLTGKGDRFISYIASLESEQKKFVEGNCKSPYLQAVYKNLYQYHNRQPPGIGEFTSKKERYRSEPRGVVSAPKALEMLRKQGFDW